MVYGEELNCLCRCLLVLVFLAIIVLFIDRRSMGGVLKTIIWVFSLPLSFSIFPAIDLVALLYCLSTELVLIIIARIKRFKAIYLLIS